MHLPALSDSSPLILASASPRRREILTTLGIPFTVHPADTEDPIDSALPPEEAVRRTAASKARAVSAQYPGRWVLGADTVVLPPDGAGTAALGKPHSAWEAAAMLRLLSGRTHQVLTGVWLCTPEGEDGFTDAALVTFFPMTEADIADYLATGEPFDKAGAYGIQGRGSRYIRGLTGDFFTVMGLPAGRLWRFLTDFLHGTADLRRTAAKDL